MAAAFSEQHKRRYVNLIERGRMPRNAAEDIGFTWSTIQSHLRSDPEFRQACEEASQRVDEHVEETLLDMALEGNLGAISKWLGARNPQKYGDVRQVQVTGAGGGPIQIATDSTDGLRQMLTSPDSRTQMLQLVREIPAVVIDVESTEVGRG